MITYNENNGNLEIIQDGIYKGLISQSPDSPEVMYPGMWDACIHTEDGGLECTDHYDSLDFLKGIVEYFFEVK